MSFEIRSLPGVRSFREVHELQKTLLEQRIRDEISDTLIFCEHAPVITRGRGLQAKPGRSERATPLTFIPEGTDYAEIERGGDLTWHGPGQLVIYPILKLGGNGSIGSAIGQDIDRYIRFLENIWIDLLREFGVETETRAHGSGVWLKDKKLASVGIALKRWVSYHGVAMNVVNELSPYEAFSPCGFSSETMMRLQEVPEIPEQYRGPDWRAQWEMRIARSLHEKFSAPNTIDQTLA